MQKPISILLILTMLIYTISISSSAHYCGGKVYKSRVGFFNYASLTCGMDKDNMFKDESAKTSVSYKCCDTHVKVFQIIDDYNGSAFEKNVKPHFILAFLNVFVNGIYQIDFQISEYRIFKPPVLYSDTIDLIQTYRI